MKKVSPAYEVFCQRKARPNASFAIPRLLSEPSFSNLKKEEDCKTVETSIRRQGFPKQIQSGWPTCPLKDMCALVSGRESQRQGHRRGLAARTTFNNIGASGSIPKRLLFLHPLAIHGNRCSLYRGQSAGIIHMPLKQEPGRRLEAINEL